MSTPKRAAAASERFAAERPPIRRGAAFDRPPRDEAEYDDDAGMRSRNARARVQMSDDERYELACYADGWREFAPGWQRRYEAAQPHNEAVRRQQEQPARKNGFVTFLEGLLLVVLIGVVLLFGWFMLGSTPKRTDAQIMPTAGIAPRPTYPPAPTLNDYGVGAYNATQEQFAPTDAPAPPTVPQEPAGDVVAPIAPVEPTALPEPGAPEFKDSFQEATCSAMITYFKGNPCYGRTGQAPLPAVGDSSFAASFK